MPDLKGMAYLRRKLAEKESRVNLRYKYYEMKEEGKRLNPVVPIELRGYYSAVMGWSAKAVDSLADRLIFKGFKDDNLDLQQILDMNNPDILPDSAILSAMISSCSFIYIADNAGDVPRLEVIDGGNATGIMDPVTGFLREGYAVLKRDEQRRPVLEAYFTPGKTEYYEGNKLIRTDLSRAPYPLLVPIVYRPDARRPFGHSRISRACMNLQSMAKRTLVRMDISADFYSYPQRYALGTSQDADKLDTWKAAVTTMLEITKDDEGEKPVVGQFQQQTMSPYTEQLRAIASMFAGETGLTMDDLGFATDNPSSAEAIKASHENLRLMARKAQRTFGTGFLNAAYLARCHQDDLEKPYTRDVLYLTKPKWAPVFEADASSLGLYGDGVAKINQALPGYFDEEKFEDLTGI